MKNIFKEKFEIEFSIIFFILKLFLTITIIFFWFRIKKIDEDIKNIREKVNCDIITSDFFEDIEKNNEKNDIENLNNNIKENKKKEIIVNFNLKFEKEQVNKILKILAEKYEINILLKKTNDGWIAKIKNIERLSNNIIKKILRFPFPKKVNVYYNK